MKKVILFLIPFFLLVVFNNPLVYAETQSTEENIPKIESITFANTSTERPLIEELKRSATLNDVTFEQSLDDYVSKLLKEEELNKKHIVRNKSLHSKDFTLIPPNILIEDITLSEIEDLKSIARNEGINLEEAIDRYAWQTQFTQVSDELEEAYPETFAGAGFEKGGGGAWFAFKHNIPKQAIETASILPATIELIGNRGFSEMELKNKLEAVHGNMYEQEAIFDVQSHYDIESGVITVEAQPLKTTKTNDLEKLKSQFQKSIQKIVQLK